MKDACARDVQEIAAYYGVNFHSGLNNEQIVNVRTPWATPVSIRRGEVGHAVDDSSSSDVYRQGGSMERTSSQHRRVSADRLQGPARRVQLTGIRAHVLIVAGLCRYSTVQTHPQAGKLLLILVESEIQYDHR